MTNLILPHLVVIVLSLALIAVLVLLNVFIWEDYRQTRITTRNLQQLRARREARERQQLAALATWRRS